MSSIQVRRALVDAAENFFAVDSIGALTGLPTLDAELVAWENRFFDKGDNPLWASVFYIPNVPSPYSVSKGGLDLLSGYIQIDFNVPLDSGEETMIAWESKAKSFFVPADNLVFEGQGVILTEAGISAGRQVENHYRKSFTVAFRSYLQRTSS
tara:strand:- start:2283 stop:2741 length:459 start_codon:yes stop_codon:yes gene_type:complete